MNAKPAGLIAVICYALLNAMSMIISGLVLIFAVGMVASAEPDHSVPLLLLGVVASVLGVALLVTIYGLWTLQEWGRKLMIWICALSIPVGLVAVYSWVPGGSLGTANNLFQWFGIALAVLVIYYLSKEPVRALFQG